MLATLANSMIYSNILWSSLLLSMDATNVWSILIMLGCNFLSIAILLYPVPKSSNAVVIPNSWHFTKSDSTLSGSTTLQLSVNSRITELGSISTSSIILLTLLQNSLSLIWT